MTDGMDNVRMLWTAAVRVTYYDCDDEMKEQPNRTGRGSARWNDQPCFKVWSHAMEPCFIAFT